MASHKAKGLRELALFAGAGGGILGGLLHGWRTVAAVEIEDYPRRVLLQRQADGILPQFPIWDDIRTFDGRPWRGRVDVITGGFPCQDISAAGKGAGMAGERSGLWKEMARIIGEVGPQYVLVENSDRLNGRGLDKVLLDLAILGYDAPWDLFGACTVGAPHYRWRTWILANASCRRRCKSKKREIQQPRRTETVRTGASKRWSSVSDANGELCNTGGKSTKRNQRTDTHSCRTREAVANTNTERLQWTGTGEKLSGGGELEDVGWWTIEPDVGRVAHGLAHRVDRLKAIGNGQVPAVAALAWEVLNDEQTSSINKTCFRTQYVSRLALPQAADE